MARTALVHDVAGVAATQAEILRAAGHDVDHVRMPEFGNRWNWFAKALTLPVRVLLYLPIVVKLRHGRYDVGGLSRSVIDRQQMTADSYGRWPRGLQNRLRGAAEASLVGSIPIHRRHFCSG